MIVLVLKRLLSRYVLLYQSCFLEVDSQPYHLLYGIKWEKAALFPFLLTTLKKEHSGIENTELLRVSGVILSNK